MANKTTKVERSGRQQGQQRGVREVDKRTRRRWRGKSSLRYGGAGLALAVVVALFVYYGRQEASGGSGVAVASALGPMTASVPSGSTGNFQRVSTPLQQGSKAVLLFIGAQYCPFCGAERWAVVKALGRFGTWSHLSQGHSSSGEAGFNSLPTFDLLRSRYTSRYVIFDHKDVADNAGNTLQKLDAQEQRLFNSYDSSGSIPLVYVDGYAMTGSDYSPAELQGKSFSDVQRQLQQNGKAIYVKDVNAEANLLTAFLCRADGNHPARVCGAGVVPLIERAIR